MQLIYNIHIVCVYAIIKTVKILVRNSQHHFITYEKFLFSNQHLKSNIIAISSLKIMLIY